QPASKRIGRISPRFSALRGKTAWGAAWLMPLAAEAAWTTAARFQAGFCSRGGALAALQELALTAKLRSQAGLNECWWLSYQAWTDGDMTQAWFPGKFLEGPSSALGSWTWEEAANRCKALGAAWQLWPVTVDLPRYVHDLRGCGRVRRDLWSSIDELKSALAPTLPFRREVHLCIPSACRASEVAAGPVVLWLAHGWQLKGAMSQLPPPALAHANVSIPSGTQHSEWLHVRTQGRLGNLLMDLANGLAQAARLGKRGVVLHRGFELSAAAGRNDGRELLGDLFGEKLELDLSAEDRRLLFRRSTRCGVDVASAGLVSAATHRWHWSFSAWGNLEGAFQSCALHLALRRRILRSVLLPRLEQRCSLSATATDVVTIHLRGGDTIPAVSPEHAQPPCAVYDHVLSEDGFQHIEMLAQRPMHHVPVTVAHRGAACVEMAMLRIVAEDGKNPCLAHLLSRYPTKIRGVQLGGSLLEAACALLSASNLVLAKSSFTGNLALLGLARKVFAPLPAGMFAPGPTSFGLPFYEYFAQLCSTFNDSVGYQPGDSYFVNNSVPRKSGSFGHLRRFRKIPAERTATYPSENLVIFRCHR
ncbi:unnamed protein product, partial [Effrenium voratum]